MICDEVINGFGRTGTWFGIDNFGVEPDMMTMAKGLTSGYQPLAAVGVSSRVAEAFEGDADVTFVGGITFGAHPVACAVALANLDIIEGEGLVENSVVTGAYLDQRLRQLVEDRRTVSATRGLGLMRVVELQKDPETGLAFGPEDQMPQRLTQALRQHGLLSRAGAAIAIAPPLVATEADCDELVERLDKAIAAFESAL